MEDIGREKHLKHEELKFYAFLAVSAILFIPDKWYLHLINRGGIKISIGLMIFGIAHCRFNKILALKYRESRGRLPKFLQFLGGIPNLEALKIMGAICFGLGAVLFISLIL